MNEPTVRLALAEDAGVPALVGPWIGPLVALGGRIARYSATLTTGRQLVVVLSVPQRDFAAALIGTGWILNSSKPEPVEPLDLLRGLDSGTPVRIVTSREVIADQFRSIDEANKIPRIRLAGSQWAATSVHAAAVLHQELDRASRQPIPRPGKVAQIARLDEVWAALLAAPSADLAIVGTLKWLLGDLAGYLTRHGESGGHNARHPESNAGWTGQRKAESAGLEGALADLLLPANKNCATWFTRLYAAARFADHLPLPGDIRSVILDGSGAIKYVAEVEAPIVICILDRSIADETAAEIAMQLRNSRGEPISLKEDLGWHPPAGIEALAFTVPL